MPETPEATDDAVENIDAPVQATPEPPKKEKFEDVYLQFREEHGVNAAGNLEPIDNIGLDLTTTRIVDVDGELVQVTESKPVRLVQSDKFGDEVPARIIPGTRILHIGSRVVADALLAIPTLFEQIEPPKKAQIDQAVAATRDAVEQAGNLSEEN